MGPIDISPGKMAAGLAGLTIIPSAATGSTASVITNVALKTLGVSSLSLGKAALFGAAAGPISFIATAIAKDVHPAFGAVLLPAIAAIATFVFGVPIALSASTVGVTGLAAYLTKMFGVENRFTLPF